MQLPGIYSKETQQHKNPYDYSLEALFVIEKYWKQHKCPYIGEWLSEP